MKTADNCLHVLQESISIMLSKFSEGFWILLLIPSHLVTFWDQKGFWGKHGALILNIWSFVYHYSITIPKMCHGTILHRFITNFRYVCDVELFNLILPAAFYI